MDRRSMLVLVGTVVAGLGKRARLPVGLRRATIARLHYYGGGDWYNNPSSLPNLLTAIGTRTSIQVERTEARVSLLDQGLWDYPYLYATGHGNIRLGDGRNRPAAGIPRFRWVPARR